METVRKPGQGCLFFLAIRRERERVSRHQGPGLEPALLVTRQDLAAILTVSLSWLLGRSELTLLD
jgi:hypothetical protein